MAGRKAASVLPLAVAALIMTSFFALRIGLIAFSWMSLSSTQPCKFNHFKIYMLSNLASDCILNLLLLCL